MGSVSVWCVLFTMHSGLLNTSLNSSKIFFASCSVDRLHACLNSNIFRLLFKPEQVFSIPLASVAWCSSQTQMYSTCDIQSHGKKLTLTAQCQACDFNKSYKKLIFPNSWYGSVASVFNGWTPGYSCKLNKTSKSFNFQAQRLQSL